jgi:hypothetical protein
MRRISRISQRRELPRCWPVGQWWMTDTRNPVNYTFNIIDGQEDEQLHKAAQDTKYCTLMKYNTGARLIRNGYTMGLMSVKERIGNLMIKETTLSGFCNVP